MWTTAICRKHPIIQTLAFDKETLWGVLKGVDLEYFGLVRNCARNSAPYETNGLPLKYYAFSSTKRRYRPGDLQEEDGASQRNPTYSTRSRRRHLPRPVRFRDRQFAWACQCASIGVPTYRARRLPTSHEDFTLDTRWLSRCTVDVSPIERFVCQRCHPNGAYHPESPGQRTGKRGFFQSPLAARIFGRRPCWRRSSPLRTNARNVEASRFGKPKQSIENLVLALLPGAPLLAGSTCSVRALHTSRKTVYKQTLAIIKNESMQKLCVASINKSRSPVGRSMRVHSRKLPTNV